MSPEKVITVSLIPLYESYQAVYDVTDRSNTTKTSVLSGGTISGVVTASLTETIRTKAFSFEKSPSRARTLEWPGRARVTVKP